MRRVASALLTVAVLGSGALGCKFFEKKVPEDIAVRAITQQLRYYPNGASAICGQKTRGFDSVNVTLTKRGEKNTGTAHIKGKPMPGADDLPAKCEGDVEFQFSYTTKSYGSRRRRRTETTWVLEKLKVVAVQTKGVKFEEAADDKTGSTDDDEDESTDKSDKSDKKKSDD